MKKFYYALMLAFISSTSFGQVATSWWQFLPADYLTNKYQRQQILVQEGTDAMAENNTATEIWNMLNEESKFSMGTVDGQTPGTADDFSGKFGVFVTPSYLVLSFDINDDVVDANDLMEIVFAPYTDKYIPTNEILPGGSAWNATTQLYSWGGTSYTKEVYHDMVLYSLWGETGAGKVAFGPINKNEDGVLDIMKYTLSAGALNDSPDNTKTSSEWGVYNDLKTGGSYIVVIMPWSELADGSPFDGTTGSMSLAVKYVDGDRDLTAGSEIAKDGYWGGTSSNGAYWAAAYYGAIAAFDFNTSINRPIVDLGLSYSDGILFLPKGNIATVTVCNILGVEIDSFDNVQSQIQLGLNTGVYIAKVKTVDGQVGVLKFMVD